MLLGAVAKESWDNLLESVGVPWAAGEIAVFGDSGAERIEEVAGATASGAVGIGVPLACFGCLLELDFPLESLFASRGEGPVTAFAVPKNFRLSPLMVSKIGDLPLSADVPLSNTAPRVPTGVADDDARGLSSGFFCFPTSCDPCSVKFRSVRSLISPFMNNPAKTPKRKIISRAIFISLSAPNKNVRQEPMRK